MKHSQRKEEIPSGGGRSKVIHVWASIEADSSEVGRIRKSTVIPASHFREGNEKLVG